MDLLHPIEPFSRLYLHCRRQRLRVVKGGGLYVDKARKHRRIAVEQPAPAVRAEAAHCGTGRVDCLRLSLRQCQSSFAKHGPSHHRRARTSTAVAAMAKGNDLWFPRELIGNRATQALPGVGHNKLSLEYSVEEAAHAGVKPESDKFIAASTLRRQNDAVHPPAEGAARSGSAGTEGWAAMGARIGLRGGNETSFLPDALCLRRMSSKMASALCANWLAYSSRSWRVSVTMGSCHMIRSPSARRVCR